MSVISFEAEEQTIQKARYYTRTAKALFIALLGIAILALPVACAAETTPIPVIDAKALDGKTVKLPGSAKPVVLVFGFARSAKAEGEAWGKRLIELQHEGNEFSFFQVAMLAGAPHFTRGVITRAIRASVPRAYHSHVLLLTDNEQAWRDLLHVQDEGSAYVVLCSPTGEIQWQGQGAGQAQFKGLQAQLHRVVEGEAPPRP